MKGEKIAEEKVKKEPRPAKLGHAIISFGLLTGIMALSIIVYGVNVYVPMFCGVVISAIIALYLGFEWSFIEKAMMDGIYNALQAVIILMIVGILVGIWVVSGVVPAMIYYGLKLLTPSLFLLAAMLICSITSLATGTAWGTMGLALMGIALGLGIPAPMSAGTCTSELIPWNTCGVYILATLGVSTFEYFPYACFNYLMPITVAVMAVMGLSTFWTRQFPCCWRMSCKEKFLHAGSEYLVAIRANIERILVIVFNQKYCHHCYERKAEYSRQPATRFDSIYYYYYLNNVQGQAYSQHNASDLS